MAKMPRKDYNGTKDVPSNNEVLKRVNTQNAPNSFQATGHDLKKDRSIPMTAANIDALVAGSRLLDISQEKFVKTVTKSVVPGSETETVSLVVTYKNPAGTFVDVPYTKQDLLLSSSLFIAKPTV